MSAMSFQNVQSVLREMKENADYQDFSRRPMENESFHEFWLEVNVTSSRCMAISPNPPTMSEIRERLDGLRDLTVGSLARFRPFIERAQRVLADA